MPRTDGDTQEIQCRVKIRRHANGFYTVRVWDEGGYHVWHHVPDYDAAMAHAGGVLRALDVAPPVRD